MPDSFTKLPPEIMGIVLAMSIGLVRVVYDENETKPIRILMESLVCGGLSVTATAAIMALNLDSNWAVFCGGIIGFMGTVTVRALALKLINKKLP